jgi:hypothetical protein
MKRLKDTELIDLLDEKLDVTELHANDAEQLEDAKLAMMALKAWEEAEPVAVSPDFWPKLRDKLPERPARSPLGSFASTLGAWLWPSHSPLAASMRVAVLAAILALASFWFAPQNATNPAAAKHSPAETEFIQRSLKKHDNYVVAQPKDGSPAIRAGDSGAAENGDASPKSDYVP